MTLSGNASITYVGQFEEGLRHGNGTLTYNVGSDILFKYSGGFLHNSFNGVGILEEADGTKYEGEWVEGEKHGNGSEYTNTGATYKGEFKQGKKHGYGLVKFASGTIYDGEWKNDKRHGNGTMVLPDGVFVGEFKNDLVSGYGVLIRHDGSSYVGEFHDDDINGFGTTRAVDGTVYIGTHVNSFAHGFGNVTYPDISTYVGQFKEGLRHGNGTFVYGSSYGNRKGDEYTGEWINGKRGGFGELVYYNGSIYKGFWENDLKHGCGNLTFMNGSSIIALWKNDIIIDDRCLEHIDLLELSNGQIQVGEFKVNELEGLGLKVVPGRHYQHGIFEDGEFLQGIELSESYEIIFSSFKKSAPFGKGYVTQINNFDIVCKEWDLSNSSNCDSNMKIVAYDGYFNEYGQFFDLSDYNQSSICEGKKCYIGNLRNKKPHGFGIMFNPHQETFIGQFYQGVLDGSGISVTPSSKFRTIYFGGWKRGKRNGAGVFIYPEGKKLIGIFKAGKIVRDINSPVPIYIN